MVAREFYHDIRLDLWNF